MAGQIPALLVVASLCSPPSNPGQPVNVNIINVEQISSVWDVAGLPVGKAPVTAFVIWYTYHIRATDDMRVKSVPLEVEGGPPDLGFIRQLISRRYQVRDCTSGAGVG